MDGSRHYQLWRRWSKASGCETPAGRALRGVDRGMGMVVVLPGVWVTQLQPCQETQDHSVQITGFCGAPMAWGSISNKAEKTQVLAWRREREGTCGRCHGGLTFSYPSEVLDALHGLSRPWLPSCLIFCFRKWPLLLWSIHDVWILKLPFVWCFLSFERLLSWG